MSAGLKVAWRSDIQGLRAIAVALVIADHFGAPGVAGGFVGVDVFFVISGFLITTLLVREARRAGRISLRDFYARRARRLLPAATLVLVTTLLSVAVLGSLNRTQEAGVDALWSAAFLANLHFASAGTDYFASDVASPFQHFWSLAVEEQFYLVWPLLLAFMVRHGVRRRVTLTTTSLLTAASLVWSIHLSQSAPEAAYFSSSARAFELGCGVLLALAGPRLPRGARVLLGITGATVLAWGCTRVDATTPFPGWHALIPVAGTVALLASGKGPTAKLLALPPLRWLGDISYSLYLWHWPVLVLGREQLPAEWSAAASSGVLVGATLLLSIVSYLAIERPFQLRRVPLVRGRSALVLWPVTIGLVFGAVQGANAHATALLRHDRDVAYDWYQTHPAATQEQPEVFRPEQAVAQAVALARQGAPLPPTVDLAALKKQIWHVDYPCAAREEESSVRDCAYGDTAATRTVVVTGDSHAGMWLPALDLLGRRDHYRVVPLIKTACLPFDVPQSHGRSPTFPSCVEFREFAAERIAELRPDAVIVGFRGMFQVRRVPGLTAGEAWSRGVTSAMQAIAPHTGQLVVLADLPVRPVPAPDCLSTPGADQVTCLAPASGEGMRMNPLTRAALAGIGNARVVDTIGLFCADRSCPLVVEEGGRARVLYFDDDHINSAWAEVVAPRFGELLGELVETSQPDREAEDAGATEPADTAPDKG